jgi:hypothetical protein
MPMLPKWTELSTRGQAADPGVAVKTSRLGSLSGPSISNVTGRADAFGLHFSLQKWKSLFPDQQSAAGRLPSG